MRASAPRSIRFLALAAAVTMALAPALAEARAGRGGSMGSRGANTYNSAPATPTAPAGRPVERSALPAQSGPQSGFNQARPNPMQPQGSFFQRNPFLGGLMGGLIGAGLIGMLMGSGFGAGGFAGMLGMLLQLALIGGLVYLAVMFFRRRSAANNRPAYAGGPAAGGPDRFEPSMGGNMPRTGLGGMAGGFGGSAGPLETLNVEQQDYEAFERRLQDIQAAWSRNDIAALDRSMTPEMVGYFREQLEEMKAQGVENRISDVKLLQGDLAEAWVEGQRQYATVAMRWEAKDVTVETATGRVIEGDPNRLVETTEIWTFQRIGRYGDWMLSAIQQV